MTVTLVQHSKRRWNSIFLAPDDRIFLATHVRSAFDDARLAVDGMPVYTTRRDGKESTHGLHVTRVDNIVDLPLGSDLNVVVMR